MSHQLITLSDCLGRQKQFPQIFQKWNDEIMSNIFSMQMVLTTLWDFTKISKIGMKLKKKLVGARGRPISLRCYFLNIRNIKDIGITLTVIKD